MATNLTPQQRDELRQHGNQPVPVIDPETKAVYFLVTGEVFERLKRFLGDESMSPEDAYAAQSAVAGAAGWDDPEMDVYDHYDENKSQL